MAQLATRMRPETIDQIIGQEHLTGPEGVITRLTRSGGVGSMILYGPPGTGKTSIAHALSGTTGIPFNYFNASTDPKKKLQDFAKKASPENPYIILLDEIHRLNRPNQDFLLPYMESGAFIVVGATTENPYITIAPALRSRTQIFQVNPLQPEDIGVAIQRALKEDEFLNKFNFEIEESAMELLLTRTNGDVRHALNALEFAINGKGLPLRSEDDDVSDMDDIIDITTEDIEQVLQQRILSADKDGDSHYNLLSAFQKSIRGSDVNASIHYLARILESGDLDSVVRRLTVIAYEDIGLANPDLWQQTMTAMDAAKSVGLPEATIVLSAIVSQLALSPKSNTSYMAYKKAVEDLNSSKDMTIPAHLRDAHYKGADELGSGVGYKYPHSYPYAVVQQQYLPDGLRNTNYFEFKESEHEQKLEQALKNLLQFHK